MLIATTSGNEEELGLATKNKNDENSNGGVETENGDQQKDWNEEAFQRYMI